MITGPPALSDLQLNGMMHANIFLERTMKMQSSIKSVLLYIAHICTLVASIIMQDKILC